MYLRVWQDGRILRSSKKAQLEKVQTILIKVLALTERGRGNAAPLEEVVQRRLEEVGYTIVKDRKQPHDVEFRVKCEERKKWAGTTRAGGDAELADAPARLWKGPACLFAYYLQGRDLGMVQGNPNGLPRCHGCRQKSQCGKGW